jgi:hypothetical protein
MLRRTSIGTYVTNESKLVGLINHIYDSCTDDTVGYPYKAGTVATMVTKTTVVAGK